MLENDDDSLDGRVTTLEGDITTLGGDITTMQSDIDALENKTQVLDNIGATISTAPPDKSVSSGTSWVNLGSFNLQAGTWVVVCFSTWTTNADGYRGICISATSGGDQISLIATDIRPAVSGNRTPIRIVTLLTPTSDTTYYLNGMQNSGSTLTAYPRIMAVRIK